MTPDGERSALNSNAAIVYGKRAASPIHETLEPASPQQQLVMAPDLRGPDCTAPTDLRGRLGIHTQQAKPASHDMPAAAIPKATSTNLCLKVCHTAEVVEAVDLSQLSACMPGQTGNNWSGGCATNRCRRTSFALCTCWEDKKAMISCLPTVF